MENIILAPVTYTKGAKPLTIKIGTFFTVQNYGELLDINIKSDFIECENFIVLNPTPTKLNINLNNKSPYLDGLASTSKEAKKPNAGIITNDIGIFFRNYYESF